jgi:glycosyltransferase involved in cell wall biosynthesis
MVSREPVVTVLMATRNGSRFIEEALRSVLSQTYRAFELIVVDDVSTDSTSDILARVQDKRIKLVRNTERLGLTRSLNRGLAMARGLFIARIDDDDIWASTDKIERQVSFMTRSPAVGLVGTHNIVIDENGQELYRLHVAVDDVSIRHRILRQNQFFHSGVLIRRRALEDVGRQRGTIGTHILAFGPVPQL